MKALSVEHVTKSFRLQNKEIFTAVKDVSLTIEAGQIYGLLGPNGAGKSTLISMICGALKPNRESGSIHIFGKNIVTETEDAKCILGVVPQELVVEPAFTVEEVLYYFSGMYGVPKAERAPRAEALLKELELWHKRGEKARSLSGGMKRRLMIAKALMHRPKLLILDEPTAGVDVALRQKIWELVRRINREGTTIVFTTHYLEEAEQLCEGMTVIHQGQVIKEGKVRDIQQEFSQNLITFELFDTDVPHLPGTRRIGVEYEYPMQDLASDMNRVIEHYGRNLKTIKNEAASLEKVFLALTEGKV